MPSNNSSGRAVVALMLALVSGQAVHWLNTPAQHPDATDGRAVAVALQAVAGWGGFIWLAPRCARATRNRAALAVDPLVAQ